MTVRVVVKSILLGLICVLAFWGVQVFSTERGTELAYTPNNLIRLHVIANSDTATDQALKLKVRDRILAETRPLLEKVSGTEEAARILKASLPRLQAAAQDELRRHGSTYPVQVEMGRFSFPTRAYGTKILPAGEYEAVRVVIGRGNGRNWWCVIFPPLCFLNVDTGNHLRRVEVRPTPQEQEARLRVIIRWETEVAPHLVLPTPVTYGLAVPRLSLKP